MGQLLVDGRFSIEVPRFFNIIIKNNNTLITWSLEKLKTW